MKKLTEPKRAAISLNEFKHFFYNSYDLACIANVNGYFEILNPNWEKVLGYSEKELLENQFLNFIHPDDMNSTLQEIEKLKSGAVTINFVNRYRKKDGTYLWFNWSSTPDPTTGKLYAIARDITESRKAEANLRAIFNSAFVSIIKTDMRGIITHFNRGAEVLLGYKAEEVIDKHTPALIHLADEVRDRSEELTRLYGREIKGFDVFVELAKRGRHESRKWTYVRKDGSTFPVQLVVTAITEQHGEVKGFLGIATDITNLERAKSELETLANHLQKQNNQLLDLAYIISHNLSSPVGNLKSLLNFYKESDSQEYKEMILSKFITVINHLTTTLDELMEVLRIKEDTIKDREILVFENIFNKTKDTLAGYVMETNAKVTCDFSRVSQIHYPKSYMESIMLNLFSNAIKYRSPDRIPEIHFETKLEDNEIILVAKDNGLGIDLEKYGHKLFGLNKTFHSHPDARGVGLYITKTQIEAMGGVISAESAVDKGTTFKIVFNKKSER